VPSSLPVPCETVPSGGIFWSGDSSGPFFSPLYVIRGQAGVLPGAANANFFFILWFMFLCGVDEIEI